MNNTGKVQYLEGIRGVAALMVVFHHFFLAFFPAYYLNGDPKISHLGNLELEYWRSPISFMTNGDFMVCIFFVLSGYVLSRSYFKSNNVQILVSSAVRRFSRLYLPMAVALILAYIVLISGLKALFQTVGITHSAWLLGTVPEDTSFSTFFQCLTYRTIFFMDNRYVTSTWTLSIELYGSMMIFAILALTHNTRLKWLLIIAAGCVAYFFCNEYYLGFILGMFLNYVERIDTSKIKYRGFVVALLLILGLIMGGFPSWTWAGQSLTFYNPFSSGFFIDHYKTIHLIGGALVIVAALLSPRFQKIFSGKVFVFLGDISFSSYLIHPVIISTVSMWVFMGLYQGPDSYNNSVIISLLVTVVTTLLVAKLMSTYVDKPATRFSKNMYTRFFKAN